ncbi:MAG: 2'-5' RNA ligase family protein [Turneriella sp.]
MSNYTLWFLAILPPADVSSRVRDIQQEIADNFGPRRAMRIPVHITVEPPFRRDASDAGWISERLSGFFASENAFELELRDFGAFRHDVIFIDVVANLHLLEMQQRLSDFLRAQPAIIGTAPFHAGYRPHMTVANRDVEPEVHKRIWAEFKARRFYARFRVEAITLLRHDGKEWHTHREFPLSAQAA